MSAAMTTAFVLSGGGSLGAVQVGMLQALATEGIEPDLLVGTSAGALNALWVAGHGMSTASLQGLAAVWVGLRRADVFPVDSRRVFRALLGREAAVSSADGLANLVRRHTAFAEVSEAPIPVHFVATDVLSGRDVLISDGPVVSGVVASAAIPGVFAPVVRDGRHLVDGALAQHAGVAQAVALGADEVYLLPTRDALRARAAPAISRRDGGSLVDLVARAATRPRRDRRRGEGHDPGPPATLSPRGVGSRLRACGRPDRPSASRDAGMDRAGRD